MERPHTAGNRTKATEKPRAGTTSEPNETKVTGTLQFKTIIHIFGGSGGERASDGTRKDDHSGGERALNDIGEGRRGGGSGGRRNRNGGSSGWSDDGKDTITTIVMGEESCFKRRRSPEAADYGNGLWTGSAWLSDSWVLRSFLRRSPSPCIVLPVTFFSIQAVALTAEVGFWSWRQWSPDLRRGGFIVRGTVLCVYPPMDRNIKKTYVYQARCGCALWDVVRD
ncbi:hypothetical protein Bca4012_006795 [Brassica carinata]